MIRPFLFLRHKLMITASWLPLGFLLRMDRMKIWPRDEAGFSFWTDAHYWQYCREDRKHQALYKQVEDAYDDAERNA